MALLPPIGLVGVVALAFLLLLLYVHQGYVSPVARARYQRPLWALLDALRPRLKDQQVRYIFLPSHHPVPMDRY